MRTMSATIQIDAAPMRVWAILTDLSRSPEWNPLFRSAAGEVTLTRPGSAGVGPLWEGMAPRKSRTPADMAEETHGTAKKRQAGHPRSGGACGDHRSVPAGPAAVH